MNGAEGERVARIRRRLEAYAELVERIGPALRQAHDDLTFLLELRVREAAVLEPSVELRRPSGLRPVAIPIEDAPTVAPAVPELRILEPVDETEVDIAGTLRSISRLIELLADRTER